MENNIILCTTSGGNVSIQVKFEDDTFWLTQKRMADLFGVDINDIGSNVWLYALMESATGSKDKYSWNWALVYPEVKK